MFLNLRQPPFPAPWLVLTPVAPFIAGVVLVAASRYTSVILAEHGRSAWGHILIAAFFACVAVAAAIEFTAVVVALRVMLRSGQARTPPNIAAVVFGVSIHRVLLRRNVQVSERHG
jgi:hypothetical protein